jgi:hypothetical protein
MKRFLITATLAACAAATLSASTITSFVFSDQNGCYAIVPGGNCGGVIGVTLPGSTSNPFINPVNLPNGTYFLFFGPEQYFEGFSGRLDVGFSDGTSTSVNIPAEPQAFFSTSQPITTTGDPSISISSVSNIGVDRVGAGTLTPNGVPDAILSFSNVPASSTAPEPATGGMVVGTFGLLAWVWRKRARTVR